MPINIFSNLQTLSGIGEKLAGFLSGLIGGNRIVDLLYHQPSHINSKKFLPPLYEIKTKELIIAKVKVEAHIKPANSRQPFRVRCFAPSGYLTLVFFKTFPNYIEKNFPIGVEIAISGVAERFNDELQMTHPDYVFPAAQIDRIPKNEIVYPAIGAFSQKFLRSKIALALEKIADLPEWINGDLLKQQGWQSWRESMLELHHSSLSSSSRRKTGSTSIRGSILEVDPVFRRDDELLTNNKARKRLAFDELLASQLANLIAKKYLKTKNGRALENKKRLAQKLIEALPFKLTASQQKVLSEIEKDLTSTKKMLRLLQGDVGSGKTIVAFLAMLLAVENKKQAAIICPITLLAIQHHKNFVELAEKIGIRIALLTSKTTKKNKQKILEDLKNGEIDILIGTHSLLEPDIIFKDLAIAVIDEQHRFGVMQRMKLVEKGDQVDVLLMSATPIPRSLMMTFYGDMDISILNEKPKNRLAIDTRVISQNKEDEILSAFSRAIKNGEKIYWICPLIEETENHSNFHPPLEGVLLRSTTDLNYPPLEGGSNLAAQDLGRGPVPQPKAKKFYSQATLANAQELRKNKTNAENFLWYHLQNKQLGGHKFRQQHPFDKYILDFVCLEAKLIIELDGDQHGQEKSVKYDTVRTKFLEDAGYKVLRFWNNEIFNNIFGVLDFVLSELENFSQARDFDPSQNFSAKNFTLPQGEGKNPDRTDELSNVTSRFQQFQKLFGEEKVGIIHGKTRGKEKDKIMNDFIIGTTQILVATTVIEVGIDVKDATIIVIENCEQFGLSQLHQLRGRVGRGEKASYCILLYGKRLGGNGKKRLAIMKNSNDGFFIAEEDLKLRGQGEMAGKRQSGLPEYKIANLNLDLDLLQIANRQAQLLLENQGKRIDKETLRILLKIFDYGKCCKLVFGG